MTAGCRPASRSVISASRASISSVFSVSRSQGEPVLRGAPSRSSTVLDWLYYIVSELLNWIHTGLRTVGFDGDSGWAWAGAIVLLTIVLRLVLLPLFVKQARATLRMQALTPKVQEIRAKCADDKQRQREEIMQLYRSEGTNPLASCLPMLLQMPVFLGLVQVLHRISE